MIIISHRGLWRAPEERNTREAFARSFDAGLGAEIDLRDIRGEIVISHDAPQGNETPFEELLLLMNGRNLPLALNIKADGLAIEIKRLLEKYRHANYFTFDMSIPEMVFQISAGLNVYGGLSDIQQTPVLPDKIKGIWLDSFYDDWFDSKKLDEIITRHKNVSIVSAELHKRDAAAQWETIKKWRKTETDGNIALCTDKPLDALEFFGVKVGGR
jgi:glycerophosphoryl diester phosphodiesterase